VPVSSSRRGGGQVWHNVCWTEWYGARRQKISVEHVHVHSGGQAIVGAVEAGADVASGNQRRPDARAITHAPVAPLWREDQKREAVPVAGDAEREMPDARRSVARSSEGEG
jgi:hypothetical protein